MMVAVAEAQEHSRQWGMKAEHEKSPTIKKIKVWYENSVWGGGGGSRISSVVE